MTEPAPPVDPACVAVEGSLAELALGTLPGEERARVLDHLGRCDACRAEAGRLAMGADWLLQLAPQVEPPVGFETRLFERLGIDGPTGSRIPRLSGRARAAVVAGVVALALAMGFGGGWLAEAPPSATAPATVPGSVASAPLVAGSQTVGTVATYPGSPGWLMMTVRDAGVSGPVTCLVVLADGRRIPVGTFPLDYGYGAWAARLPVAAGAVRSARVVAGDGRLVATATLAT